MRKLKLACATSFVSCALVLGGQVPALAAVPTNSAPTGELDQSAEFREPGYFNQPFDSNMQLAQTFAAGIPGELTSVDVGISRAQEVNNLTIEITPVSSGLPSGNPLARTQLIGEALSAMAITGTKEMFTVDFASPARIKQGTVYAIVASTTGGGSFAWYTSTPYSAGQAAINNGSGWTDDTSHADRSFATYVTVTSPSNEGSSETAPAPSVLTLTLPQGVQCAASTLTASGPWIALPSSGDCSITPRGSGDDPSLLGWATTPDFPVDIAQRQVDNGWGAYETFGDDGRLTGVFIPAGGYTTLTADTNLYPIWS